MLVAFIMGFSCGLPLLLTMGVLQAWMKDEGIDLTLIGLINLVQIPYTWKFIWAPLMDRYTLPFLGRRRGWMLIAQLALIVSITGLGFSNPADHFWMMVVMAILVAFFSATQDIVVDAYRREDLSDKELGLGSSLYISGYRLGSMLAAGGGLIMADHIPWSIVYMVMGLFMLIGVIATILSPEPITGTETPRTIKDAVIEPFAEYFKRRDALWMLAFILLYKIGDNMVSGITIPFYLEIGFTKTEIGAVVKIFGMWAIIAGALVGGTMMLRLGINRSLWLFGFLQAISSACFAILAQIGPSIPALSAVIAFENISMGMGSAAQLAFMASITDKRFTATQYAMLSSLAAIPRVIISAPTGYMAKHMGWEAFFIMCALIAIPGMLLLIKSAPWNSGEAIVNNVNK
ncbi:MAG TPA: AmpG family muropeptide MFS transporter [Desulfatiglandales bacterium]|nr:AmpG family muropeptide MFS transporter [Desulfatiglandales bacterium]